VVRATIYIMACSAKNRARRRLARLREPRYMIGAVVGIAYLYFAIFGRMRLNRMNDAPDRRRPTFVALFPALATTGPVLGGIGLLAMAAFSWLMPVGSRLLDFSRVETEMLFPAPVTRRQLLVYRLLRSQLAVVIGAVIFALVYPVGSVGARVRGLLSVWLLLTSSSVFFTGVTLWRAQTRSTPRSIPARLANGIPLGLSIGGLAALALAVFARASETPIANATEAMNIIVQESRGPFVGIVLVPFVALVRPLFADSWSTFAAVIPGALAVYAALVCWILMAGRAVDIVAEGTVERLVQQQTVRPSRYRARPVRWVLAPIGRPETVFVWKNFLQTMRIVDRRVLLRGVAILAWATFSVSLAARVRGVAQVVGIFAAFLSAFTVTMGPQIFKTDLRQDLLHLEVLKTWPLRAAAVIRGEMIWPACLVTLLTWVIGTVALTLSAAAFETTGLALRTAVGLAALVLTPGIVLAQFTVHNAAALMFPAWVLSGQGRARGVDAFGQRLIMLGGTLIVVIVALLPVAIIGGVMWLLFRGILGPWVLIPAAILGLVLMIVEVLAATEALGPAFERLDITSVERAE
jgi:hypothetical protein